MAKLSAIVKNNKRRQLADKFEAKRAELRKIIASADASDEDRDNAQIKLQKMPRDTSRIRVRNRCELTGRPRAFYRDFKLSRIALRELAHQGLIPGVTKASW